EQLRRGVVPLWNPYMLCGTPFVANDQSAVFYPETWLFAALEPERAFAWAAFAAVFASGCFMFAFLRTWGLRRRAAMVGAVAWMYNGFAVGWMCLPSFRSVPVWLPLLLASIAGLSSGRKVLVWTGVGAVAVAMNFLAGNLHISFYVLLTAVAFAGWMALAKRPRLFGVLAGTAAFMAVGAAMAAVQLLPTVEYAFRSHRQHISYDTVLMYRLPWPYLAACLMPDLFGNPVDYNHWGCMLGDQYRAYTETAWYAGAVTVVLAVLAFRRGRWRADALFWGAVAVVALALAVGSPLNYLFYASVPGFRQLPGINRAIVMAAFALATLGAIGAQGLLESSEVGAQRSRMGRALSSAAAGVTLVGGVSATWAWVYSGRYEAALGVPLASYTGLQFLRFLAAVLVPVGAFGAWLYRRCNALWNLAVVALALDMSYFAAHFTPMVSPRYCRPPSEIVGLLQRETVSSDAAGLRVRLFSEGSNPITGRMPPNVPMLFGLYDIQGSDSITYGRYVRLLQHLRPSQEEENGKFSQPCV
ncbi:MAG: hypothetical protein H5T86_15315, partial [Armatimonadetes bacterium]|nr:hypothetical protein [Armatimonadota bacterium]